MNADFSDIRFVDASDNALSYWIESYTASTSAVVWVKVASGAEAISVVYGNAEATDASDPVHVFDFWEPFDGTTVNTAVWDKSGAGMSVADGIFTVTGASSAWRKINSKATFGTDYAVRSRAQRPSSAGSLHRSAVGFMNSALNRYAAFFSKGDINNDTTVTNDGTEESKIYETTTDYHIFDICRNGTTNVKFYVDGTLAQTHDTIVPSDTLPVCIGGYNSTGKIYVDWILVRKTQATEPVCTVGDAEANGGSSGVAGAAGKFLCLLRR